MKCYVSYADEDVCFGQRLKTRWASASQPVFTWSLEDARPGRYWQREMVRYLLRADVFLPLLSTDFLISPWCQEEVRVALDWSRMSSLRVLPILLAPCAWQASPLASFPVLPDNGRPVLQWEHTEEAWHQVFAGLIATLFPRTVGQEEDLP